MDRYPSFAGQTVLVSDSTPAIGLTALARDGSGRGLLTTQRNRAERPSPIPHFAPAPAGCVPVPQGA